ncbi:hypothetical protein H5410_000041 [Solanum commersonii]|uniref:Uncharacterized protein n=1 Tax=Solanum commersonii TaxID=4109 RepID=A0A9J6AV60_SOLCO|nr:hypothetical protein H5410_000041 [Solanum commersonii]
MVPPRTHKPLMPKRGTTMRLVNKSYFKTSSGSFVSDIGIEDTIVDNREDNGVDKNILIEGNSTKVVLQGIRGDVTNEVDEEFSDPDYNLSNEDDDFRDVIDDQQVLIDDQQVLIDDQQVLIVDQQVKKLRGPKNASVNVPVSSGILVPLQNADVESDYAYSDELPDDDVQSDKGENNGQKNNIYEEYDEGAKVFDNFHLSPRYIARKYLNIFKGGPGWNISGIVEIVRKDFDYTIENLKAWRVKNQALKWIYVDEGLQYGKLLSYRAELLRSNHGSNVVIWRDGENSWDFMCVWEHLRKLLNRKYMEALDQEDKAAREWFNNPNRPFQSWTRALFRTNTKCDMLLNNLCESFNMYILDARDKAIITMLEMIKKHVDEKNVQEKRVDEEESLNQGKKEPEELEKKKKVEAVGKAEKRAE